MQDRGSENVLSGQAAVQEGTSFGHQQPCTFCGQGHNRPFQHTDQAIGVPLHVLLLQQSKINLPRQLHRLALPRLLCDGCSFHVGNLPRTRSISAGDDQHSHSTMLLIPLQYAHDFSLSNLQCSVLLPVVLTLLSTQPKDSKFIKILTNMCYPSWALEAFIVSNAKRYLKNHLTCSTHYTLLDAFLHICINREDTWPFWYLKATTCYLQLSRSMAHTTVWCTSQSWL